MIWNRYARGVLRDIFGAGQAVGGGLQAAGTVGAAGIQAGATLGAAHLGADAARDAAAKQYQAAQQALGLNRDVFNQQQTNLKPWLGAGTTALGQLSAGTKPGGQFAQDTYAKFAPTGMAANALNPQGFTPTGLAATATNPQTFTPEGAALGALNPAAFRAPTAEEARATPGYQFTLEQGDRALQAAAAATGQLGGAAAKEALRYGQGLADTTYQQSYGRALGAYGTNLTADQQALSGQAGVFGANQGLAQQALGNQQSLYGTNLSAAQQALSGQSGVYGTNYDVSQQMKQQAYNRIAGLAGMGQQATQQLNTAGGAYGQQGASLLGSAGTAQAAGLQGAGNAWGSALAGLGNIAAQYPSYGAYNTATPTTGNFDYGSQASPAVGNVLAGLPQGSALPAPFVGPNPYG